VVVVVVVFVSAEYAARDWTRLERRATLARALRERPEYVLPARFDDTLLPGLLSDMATVDLRTRTPQQSAVVIADKLAALGIIALTLPADAEGSAWDTETVRPVGAVHAVEAEADTAKSVRSDALGVLSDVLMWQLAASRWQAIEEVLVAMDAALQANDLEALADATIQLELAGPLRVTRIGGTPFSTPPDAVRGRVVQLMR
jgi:hypothetical protein